VKDAFHLEIRKLEDLKLTDRNVNTVKIIDRIIDKFLHLDKILKLLVEARNEALGEENTKTLKDCKDYIDYEINTHPGAGAASDRKLSNNAYRSYFLFK
jgi:hypothetical protein